MSSEPSKQTLKYSPLIEPWMLGLLFFLSNILALAIGYALGAGVIS